MLCYKTEMRARQIRIFVPPNLDETCWVDTVVGCVIRPVVTSLEPHWFWFSRYEENKNDSGGDCDIRAIPEAFARDGFYRSVRFRFCVAEAVVEEFEKAALKLIDDAGWKVSGFLDYPYVDDLAADRFFGEPRNPARKKERAELMVRFLDASARLFFSALTGPDERGLYRLEHNDCYGSSFAATRHLFCNMTNAPTPVHLDSEGKWKPAPNGEVQILRRS